MIMTRRTGAMMVILASFLVSRSGEAQTLLSPRALSLGAYDALVRDTRGFSLNPAGLTHLRDWDFTTSTYATPTRAGSGFVFHALAFGKRLLDRVSVAAQYSPGSTVRFVVPPTIVLGPGSTATTNDRDITYSEPFAAGIGFEVAENVSAGFGLRVRRTDFTETLYDIQERDTITIPVVSRTEYSVPSWHGDAGVLWTPTPDVTVGLVARNLMAIEGDLPPGPLDRYLLSRRVILSLSTALSLGQRVTAVAQTSTQRTGNLGAEWSPVEGLALRGGVYFDPNETHSLFAVAGGVGFSYEFFSMDAAYLRFRPDQPCGDGRPYRI